MQIINVDLVPGKVMPILHASQFDKGRSLGVKLYNGGAVFELSGAEDLTAAVRKPDGNIVTETLTNAGGSLVEIITTEQMTACAGGSLCEIKIENAGDVIGTANFVLEVEKDPTDGGIASQSEINNLATQVADLVSEQYDSNNVIFDAVPTAGHGNGYTVTSEGIKDALDAINNPAASAVSYDNTDSGLTATNAQDAIDEVNDKADTNATNIGSLSTLTTTDKSSLVGAVNEVNSRLGNRLVGAWTADTSTANVQILTDDIDVTAGTYLIIMSYPDTSANFVACLYNHATNNVYDNCYMSGGSWTSKAIITAFSGNGKMCIASAQGASCTFTNKNRGSIRAIKLSNLY